jgi:uncharacterized protein
VRIGITGASGFVGTALTRRLSATGHTVVTIGRHDVGGSAAFEGLDAVVHLAGETIAGRWTAEKKRAIRSSRVDGTHALVRAIGELAKPPRVLVSASATGFYGNRGGNPLDERAGAGTDFLASVCADWEAAARSAEELGVRTVQLRTGIVLGPGGALARMYLPFKWFMGGPFGNGAQFMPWIHLDDLTALYALALEHESLRGPMNAVAPDEATNRRFAQAVGAALHRPALLPAPAFALRAVLGEFATSLLEGQRVVPRVAQQAGFSWTYDLLETATAAAFEALRDERRR